MLFVLEQSGSFTSGHPGDAVDVLLFLFPGVLKPATS